MRTRDAQQLADDAGVDLVEVAPEGKPPVCKILDYGKLKYREQKRIAAARKKAAVQVVKEIRLRYSTDEHDLETKIRAARNFIDEGDRVRFEMRFKGREIVYQDLGRQMYDKVIKALADVAAVDEMPPMQGPKMILILAPKGQAKSKG